MDTESLILCSVQKCRLLSHSWRLLLSFCTSSFYFLVFLLNFSLHFDPLSQRHWVLETQFWFQALNWSFHLFLRLPINSSLWEHMNITFYGSWLFPCSAYCLQSNQSFLLTKCARLHTANCPVTNTHHSAAMDVCMYTFTNSKFQFMSHKWKHPWDDFKYNILTCVFIANMLKITDM